VTVLFILFFSGFSFARTENKDLSHRQISEVRQGELLFRDENGLRVPAPLLSEKVDIRISGITGRVRVEQEFINISEEWKDARYVFPLPDACSVDHLLMRIGEREIEGVIKERQAARKIHEAARSEGRKTILVEQNRPNIFTTDVANIGPGEKISVK
jgi:Ca-activated chloride channel family protein